jgi:membrane protease YdiL (CAAX protease family)
VNNFNPENNYESQGAEPRAEPAFAESLSSAPVRDAHLLRWRDLAYVAAFYLVVGLALTQLALVAASSMLHIKQDALKDFPAAYVAAVAISQTLLSLAVLSFLWLLVRSRGTAPFWGALGWRAFPAGTPRAATIAQYLLTGGVLLVVVQIAGRYLHMPSGLPMDKMFRDRPSVLMTMALAILVAPLIEETLFRGCLYPVAARSVGAPAGIVLTGVTFGLMHALQLGFAWQPVLLLSVVGIVLTYVRVRAGTVLASFLVHLGYNSSLFGALYFATGGLRNFPGS